jgi:hypothetical protein
MSNLDGKLALGMILHSIQLTLLRVTKQGTSAVEILLQSKGSSLSSISDSPLSLTLTVIRGILHRHDIEIEKE